MACPAAGPAARGRVLPPEEALRPGREDMTRRASYPARDSRIVVDAFQRHPRTLPVRRLAGAKMFCNDIPHRRAALLVDRGPARDLVGLASFDRTAILEL